jgi:predicted  nucleic acid-binding Zn-ribbon protein
VDEDEERRAEFERLRDDFAALKGEYERLRAERPGDLAAHRRLRERLADYRARIRAWQDRQAARRSLPSARATTNGTVG